MPLSFAVWAPIPFLLVSQVVTFCIANCNTNVQCNSLLKAVVGSLARSQASGMTMHATEGLRRGGTQRGSTMYCKGNLGLVDVDLSHNPVVGRRKVTSKPSDRPNMQVNKKYRIDLDLD
jgi:hypothetical protein